MKKIYVILAIMFAPIISLGQTIDLSIIEDFDVSAATSCDPGLASCQKQIADLQSLIVVLLQQIIALQLQGEITVVENNDNDDAVLEHETPEYTNQYRNTPSLSSGRKKTFYVRNGEVDIDEDEHAYYREIIRLVQEIIPEYILDDFEKIIFINDSREYYAAQVRQSVESYNGRESEEWELYINMDDVTLVSDKKYNQSLQTLVHEAGHTLLTNASQLDFFTQKRDCETLYIDDLRSCAKEDSYYDTLSQFWSDDFIEWTEDYENLFEDDQDEAEEELEEYYQKNKEDFITEYAATSISEDAAETIAYYVTESFPTGLLNLAEEKIVSLFDYAEMRILKNTVQKLLQ